MLFAIVLPVTDAPLEEIADAFRNLKFDVQIVTGGSLIVSGERQLFSDAFGYAVVVDDQKQAYFLVEGKAIPELQNEHMPTLIAKLCRATEFQHAPEFGPESF